MNSYNNLHPHVRQMIKEHEYIRVKLLAFSAPYSTLERVVHEHFPKDTDGTLMFLSSYSTSVWVKIRSFTEITPLLRALAKEDFRQSMSMQKESEGFAWILKKRVRDGLEMTVKLHAEVPDAEIDGEARCKRVQTGTEVKEVPVYEVVCDPPVPVEVQDV